MKYAITGHTDGIGRALYSSSDDCIGFSLTTGFDITNKHDRHTIIDQVQDCDVFVNNAFAGYAQCELLFEIWKEWKDTNKVIISIGSDVTKYPMSLKRLEMLDYYNYKTALKNLHHTLKDLNSNVRLKYVSFGYVATEKILKKTIPEKMIISLPNAVEQIKNAANEI